MAAKQEPTSGTISRLAGYTIGTARSLIAEYAFCRRLLRRETESVARLVEERDLSNAALQTSETARQTLTLELEQARAAEREAEILLHFAQSVGSSLVLDAVVEAILTQTRELVACAAYVLFLPESGEYAEEVLRAHGAQGVNARHFLGGVARSGTYLTGRAFYRGEKMTASFLPQDVILNDVNETWVTLRATLVVPLQADERCLGTLNLYSDTPNAFGTEAERLTSLIAPMAARALDNASRYQAAQDSSLTDSLTGLPNGRYLRDQLAREVARAQRDGMPLAVLLLDLDNFKPVNDRLGHDRGDRLLRDLATLLDGQTRGGDFTARYAGDEFVVILPKTGPVQARIIADKLKQAVRQHGQECAVREPDFPAIGISAGAAIFPEDGENAQTLLANADAAMYRDKQNRVPARPDA